MIVGFMFTPIRFAGGTAPMLGFSDAIFFVGALDGFFYNPSPKNERPRQDRDEAAGTALLSDHAAYLV